MLYSGVISKILPYAKTVLGWTAKKAKDSPKSTDALAALGALASAFGMSPDIRLMASNVLMYVAKILSSTV